MRTAEITLMLLFTAACAVADDPQIQSPMTLVAAARAEINEIAPAELAGKPADGRVLIDVREPGEFEQGHIDGAVNQPRGLLEFVITRHPALAEIAANQPDQLANTEIVLYCRSGARSALAAQSLQKLGFTNVHSLAGGYTGWQSWQADRAE